MTNLIKNIAVLTSGGDAPGMNACIRAVVRTAIFNNIGVYGAIQGYEGLINNNLKKLDSRSVSGIIHLGGTILKTARSLEFKTDEGMQKAYNNLKANEIDALVVIGGDGTFKGAKEFSEKFGIKVIGIPGTIDNDLYGTDFTIGYDTALNTTIEAIDKIRDTADSHDRLFFIEVMGRDSGCIALRSAICTGAEAVLLPERDTTIEELVQELVAGSAAKKNSRIVIVAEGNKLGSAYEVSKMVKYRVQNYDPKVTVLGHLQRGGSPSAFDRILAGRLGFSAVNELLKGSTNCMVGLSGNNIIVTQLNEALTQHTFKLENDLMEMKEILSI
ncbi:6-phosphofructokinase [Pedobacter flavus]|uniref:ATP-dependent 6-phosphofructokinase n=1 Tax=Pedobacter flavus TaxID=3113906 RepID=A0ABU7GXW8_9SPHI|nr:6-phosphofructokinase [Pedobacter sp. VNH31]MEE1883872.1 6-phosphofructokinase [Pedobacter sp. VNH31]